MGIIDIFTSGYDATKVIILLGAWLIAIVFGIVVHEYAHCLTAVKMGDNTPKLAGRLSLNPARHFDPLGFIFLAIIGFGWAKPVPINSSNFRNVRKGEVLVSLSGVLTNLVFSIIFTFLLVVCSLFLDQTILFFKFITILFEYLAMINFVLAIFNLLPIFPLDGFNLIAAFCRYDNKFVVFMRNYGQWILLLLLITGAFSYIINFMYVLVIDNLRHLFLLMFI